MPTYGSFQKKPASQSAPTSFFTPQLFQSRPFREPTIAPPPEASIQTRSNDERDSNGNPTWWSQLQFSSKRAVRPKLTVGAPNDQYEQEADRTAAQVMSMPDTAVQQSIQREANPEEDEVQTKPLAASITPLVQRETMPEEEEVQTKSLGHPALQREEMPEEEPVQTKRTAGTLQREEMVGEEEDLQMKAITSIQREDMPEEEEIQTKSLGNIQREEMPEEEEALQMKAIASIQREEMPEEEEVQMKAIAISSVTNSSLQQKCSACEQEGEVQRSGGGKAEASSDIESRLTSSKGGGSPLSEEVRSFMEPRFGADFSQVQVHTGSHAVQMNEELGAQAFTHGSDIYYGGGKFPGNNDLTAHELTHVVQQNPVTQAKSNIQAELLQRDCDPTVSSCPPDQEQSSLNTDPNTGSNQSVDPNVEPNQSVDPNAGQPNQSVDPNVQPPASGVSAVANPYAGTDYEDFWKQGFDAGFTQPDEEHPAPSPFLPNAQTVYSEGVLAGKDAAWQQPNSSQSDQNQSSSDMPNTTETPTTGQEGLSTGAVIGIVVGVALVAGAIALLATPGGQALGLAMILSISEVAGGGAALTEAAVGTSVLVEGIATTATGELIVGELIGSGVAATTGATTVAPAVAMQSTVATASASSLLSLAAKVTVGAAATTAAATTLSSDSPKPSNDEDQPSKCKGEPCAHPLPILWPNELPEPMGPRLLIRTSSDEREAEGIDRGREQRRFKDEIDAARNQLIPPPNPCFDDDADPNAPYDAHHAHPLYIGGGDEEFNLCSLETGRHMLGHRRLDNQASLLPEYEACGICSGSLKNHPIGQTYEIIGSK
jgi:hypothetical protein